MSYKQVSTLPSIVSVDLDSLTRRLDPELKAEWIRALRSGKYSQGRGQLKSAVTERHCCLGVLCDIMPEYTEMPDAVRTSEAVEFRRVFSGTEWTQYLEATSMPVGEEEWLGLGLVFGTAQVLQSAPYESTNCSEDDYQNWVYSPNPAYVMFSLPELNDSGLFTFDQIADIIDYVL